MTLSSSSHLLPGAHATVVRQEFAHPDVLLLLALLALVLVAAVGRLLAGVWLLLRKALALLVLLLLGLGLVALLGAAVLAGGSGERDRIEAPGPLTEPVTPARTAARKPVPHRVPAPGRSAAGRSRAPAARTPVTGPTSIAGRLSRPTSAPLLRRGWRAPGG